MKIVGQKRSQSNDFHESNHVFGTGSLFRLVPRASSVVIFVVFLRFYAFSDRPGFIFGTVPFSGLSAGLVVGLFCRFRAVPLIFGRLGVIDAIFSFFFGFSGPLQAGHKREKKL